LCRLWQELHNLKRIRAFILGEHSEFSLPHYCGLVFSIVSALAGVTQSEAHWKAVLAVQKIGATALVARIVHAEFDQGTTAKLSELSRFPGGAKEFLSSYSIGGCW
jgi:hypothetical protein